MPCLHPGSAQHTTRAAEGQAHSLPTSTPHTAGGSLCLGGFGHVPCGGGLVGEQGSEAVRGALCLGVVPWDRRRLALGGSEDRGEDGL